MPRLPDNNPHPNYFIAYLKTWKGKDFKYLSQRCPFLIDGLANIPLWLPHHGLPEWRTYKKSRIWMVTRPLYLRLVNVHFDGLHKNIKCHLMAHLGRCVRQFGPLRMCIAVYKLICLVNWNKYWIWKKWRLGKTLLNMTVQGRAVKEQMSLRLLHAVVEEEQ
jgi:hypothetical protein